TNRAVKTEGSMDLVLSTPWRGHGPLPGADHRLSGPRRPNRPSLRFGLSGGPRGSLAPWKRKDEAAPFSATLPEETPTDGPERGVLGLARNTRRTSSGPLCHRRRCFGSSQSFFPGPEFIDHESEGMTSVRIHIPIRDLKESFHLPGVMDFKLEGVKEGAEEIT